MTPWQNTDEMKWTDLGRVLCADHAGAGRDPGCPVCRQPPSAAGAPQPLLPLPHPGRRTRTCCTLVNLVCVHGYLIAP